MSCLATEDQIYGINGFSACAYDPPIRPGLFDFENELEGSDSRSIHNDNLNMGLDMFQWPNDDNDLTAVGLGILDVSEVPSLAVSPGHTAFVDSGHIPGIESGSHISSSLSPSAQPLLGDDVVQYLPPRPIKRLRMDQTDALDSWLLEHIDDPYPTEAEKLELAAESNLTKKQIENWFSRTRQRKIPLHASGPSTSHQPGTLSTDIQFSLQLALASQGPFLPDMAACASDGIQLSLEVAPASPCPSMADIAACASEETPSHLRCASSRAKKSLCDHDGTMLQWWLDTLPGTNYWYYKERCRGHLECYSCLAVNSRLGDLERSLDGHDSASLEARVLMERALVRLLDMVSADFWVGDSRAAFVEAFRSYDHAHHPLVAETLNDIDCSISVPPAVKELILEVRSHWVDYGLTDRQLKLLEWLERLASMLESLVRQVSRQTEDESPSTKLEQQHRRYLCTSYPPCPLKFVTADHLARHRVKHTDPLPIQCHCKREFPRLEDLERHVEVVHGNEEIGRYFLSTVEEARHISGGQQNATRLSFSPNYDPSQWQQDHDSRSVGSRQSAASAVSACSYTSFGPRQGRKRPRTESLGSDMAVTSNGDGSRYFCTNCPQSFSTNYARKRHIQSIHGPQDSWVCDPSLLSLSNATRECCIWCPDPGEGKALPACSHSEAADKGCMDRSRHERTFYRKDLLLQHFRGPHRAAENCLAMRDVDLLKQE